MIEVKGLVKRFGNIPVLRGLDLLIQPGEFVALLGPNGSGKTTLIRVLASLSRANSGDVLIASSRLPGESDAVRREIGLVSHAPLLYRELTAEENLWFFGRLYQVENYQRRAVEVLELVGLQHRKNDLVRIYSRGMQQRLSIARAVLHQPQVLLLDEPYSGLDQDAGKKLDAILKDISTQGRTILMTSHDLARSAALANRIDVLSQGRINASASMRSLEGEGILQFYQRAIESPQRII